MTELKPFTDWLGECRRLGLPPDTPPPREYQNFDEWHRNSRGVNQVSGGRQLRSYGDWLYERHKLNLPIDAQPPAGVESYEDWFRRVRGIDSTTGERVTAASVLREAKPASPPSGGPSSFFRQALSRAGMIASRLGSIGQGVRNAIPALGAVSTVIHAIREGRDFQHGAPADKNELRAQAPGPQRVAAKTIGTPRAMG